MERYIDIHIDIEIERVRWGTKRSCADIYIAKPMKRNQSCN